MGVGLQQQQLRSADTVSREVPGLGWATLLPVPMAFTASRHKKANYKTLSKDTPNDYMPPDIFSLQRTAPNIGKSGGNHSISGVNE